MIAAGTPCPDLFSFLFLLFLVSLFFCPLLPHLAPFLLWEGRPMSILYFL